METILQILARELGKSEEHIQNVITLIDEGNTIPFIARYRKELHGAMDDTALRTLADRLQYLRNLDQRRQEVCSAIENQGKLTEELSAAIASASTLAEVGFMSNNSEYNQMLDSSTQQRIAENLAKAISNYFSSIRSRDFDGHGSQSVGAVSQVPVTGVTLDKAELTLAVGATETLTATVAPDNAGNKAVKWTTSDKKIATVSQDGTIKAVAPGKATITVEYDGAKATCAVTCDWKEETKPEQKPDPKPEQKPDGSGSGSSSGSGDSSTPSTNVDLSAFYSTITGKYEFGFLELADSSILDNVYPGLSGISAEQMLVYVCMISMNNGEFGLVQVKDSKDVDAVKAAFQSRIDYMVGDGNGPGGAQYPMAMDQWENNSRIVSNGNYVMMVVHESCDDIVNEFNALF